MQSLHDFQHRALRFSIGTSDCAGVAFDHERGLLFASCLPDNVVYVFSTEDGSLVSKFGSRGTEAGQFLNPWGLAIDHEHDRVLVTDYDNARVQLWSLTHQSFLGNIDSAVSSMFEFNHPQGVAIDRHHRRIIIVDTYNNRLVFLSSIDLSFLFSVGSSRLGTRPGEFDFIQAAAVDHERLRIVVTDTCNHRVQVLSLIDGSFLFEFGSQGNQPGQLLYPQGVCIANQGRIIVADSGNNRLQAFTPDGHHISFFVGERGNNSATYEVAFDEHRGLIAFSADNQVHVIGANQWLPDTFTWQPYVHRYAPSSIKRTVSTMTMIRSLVDESALSMIPNEILFEIFSFL